MLMPLSDQTSPIRSMTGFASVRADTPLGSITVSLRSVNHRGLDLHFHLGSDFAAFENDMRALLKQHIGRGHVEVRCSMDRDSASEVAFNERLVGDYLKFFRKASAEFGLDGKPDLNALLALPGVFEPVRNGVKPLDSAFTPQVTDALRACIHQ